LNVDIEKIHDSYVAELADIFENQGYKVIIEGKISKKGFTSKR